REPGPAKVVFEVLQAVLELGLDELLGGAQIRRVHEPGDGLVTDLFGDQRFLDPDEPLLQVGSELLESVELAYGLGEVVVERRQLLGLHLLYKHGERDLLAGEIPGPLGDRVRELEDRPRPVALELAVQLGGTGSRADLVQEVGRGDALDELVVAVTLEVDEDE